MVYRKSGDTRLKDSLARRRMHVERGFVLSKYWKRITLRLRSW